MDLVNPIVDARGGGGDEQAGFAHPPRIAQQVDDRTAGTRLDHGGDDGVGDPQRARHRDLDLAFPLGGVGVEERPPSRHRRVVDQHADGAQLLGHPAHRGLHRVVTADVERDGDRPAPARSHRGGGLFGSRGRSVVPERHVGALRGEGRSDGATQALARADEHRGAGEPKVDHAAGL